MKNKLILALAASLSLTGCLGLKGPKPPPTLFTLSSPPQNEANARIAKKGAAVTIVVPTVPAALQTLRIPVRVSPTEYAYVKDAQWIEAPNNLFQRLVTDTVSAKTSLVTLDPRQTSHDPGHRLTGQLLEFGLDATNASAPVAHIRYDATITLTDSNRIITRRFEITRPVKSQKPRDIAAGLNEAAGDVATQVAEWINSLSS